MKNVSFLVFVSSLVLFSCQKKSIIHGEYSDNVKQTPSGVSISSKQNAGWGICCVWNGVNACVPPAVNCFDEVIVKPKYTEVARAASKLDESVLGGSKSISEFFMSKDAQILFPDLMCSCDKNPFTDYVNKLISGNYYITISQTGNKFYYLVKQNGTNNVDFVLNIKKEGLGNN